MEERPAYYVRLEEALMGLLSQIISRPRTSILDPPVSLELVQNDLEKFKEVPPIHIEQAARTCVYRIAVSISICHINRRILLERVSVLMASKMEAV